MKARPSRRQLAGSKAVLPAERGQLRDRAAFEGPRRRLALVVCDHHVKPRMRIDEAKELLHVPDVEQLGLVENREHEYAQTGAANATAAIPARPKAFMDMIRSITLEPPMMPTPTPETRQRLATDGAKRQPACRQITLALDARRLDDRYPLLDLSLVKGAQGFRSEHLGRRNINRGLPRPAADARRDRPAYRAPRRQALMISRSVAFGTHSPVQTEK